ncbi:MAG TPA: hypothetical protein VGP95_20390, partial [Gemmatimonadaceae bacterium]|nr:hypothetical protein [Gemmatimonadaceae bacterium]
MTPSADPATARIHRRIAVLVGVFAFGFFWWVWGAWRPLPAGSDESAYLLQAKIFASGQVVADPRPFPEFFWQYHVFVDPVLAAKYPPGHSALLALGELFRAPWVIPLFAAAISSALLFLLTARWSTRGVGLLAVSLMITSETSLRFWPSYFSETTTAALFLIGWLALANYWDRGSIRWLLALAFSVGLGAITRPLTMLAFAVPAAVLTLIAMRRQNGWRQLPWAAAVTLIVVGLSFLWNQKATGDWRHSPHAEYARRFIPSDRIGFGSTATPPADSLPPELRAFNGAVQRIHARHTLPSVPRVAAARASSIARETWLYLGLPGLFALIAFISAPAGAWLIAATTIV